MPSFNFQARFADLVRTGAKRCTIRPRHSTPGQWAFCFQGLRTRACVRLGTFPIVACRPVTFDLQEELVVVDGERLSPFDRRMLALKEGFEDWQDMHRWFTDHYPSPFNAWLHEWDYERGAVGEAHATR